ncbi:MAG: 23S rRNA (pseudouridine(1915)-N(3))-methyltransferase RlmH [Firmicutes bacterium]|jgi:23S rRNA (pseudouridine1915-N3)-methyltransferase|nr:23S rRNA (pseudouridine(1915)-N(3))-methyltransferase RlmH [Dethiobacter sp.]MBS3898249.1 23S rRNA (pseudouridine(1915)-N(3))-methyltransferase RlmH [Dethiobacter sp.]MCL4463459.1 23S rRNA (pseudouridine(1915)-N(3))-methyltransferase RlmH [Bacillota bacterium]MCL5993338.1 23S rRNA (pseudouridine(1915)-N(3))-methyltransferase RlmH [Bacillota bacterium]
MQIEILTVGKIKERYLTAGIAEYLKRLSSYANVIIREVKAEKIPEGISVAEGAQLLDEEAARLGVLIKQGTYLIVLDLAGGQLTSLQLAARLDSLATAGKSHLTFIVGGSLGLSPRLRRRADLCLSFSAMTFPHQLFRLMLLEQIYRALKINRGEPYHK